MGVKLLRKHVDRKGVTIVELVVALTILLTVLGLSYFFYFYTTKAFLIVDKQSEVQQKVRFAKEMIDQKLRMASSIKIIEDPIENYQRIYNENGSILYVDKNGVEKKLLENLSDDIHLKISFKKKEISLLEINVEGDFRGEYDYSINSQLFILQGNIDGEEGNKVCFIQSTDS